MDQHVMKVVVALTKSDSAFWAIFVSKMPFVLWAKYPIFADFPLFCPTYPTEIWTEIFALGSYIIYPYRTIFSPSFVLFRKSAYQPPIYPPLANKKGKLYACLVKQNRTIWGWNLQKNKHIEAGPKFTGSYKKNVYFMLAGY